MADRKRPAVAARKASEPIGMWRRIPNEDGSRAREAAMPRTTQDVPHDRPLTDCAWCGVEFANIVELLAHVEDRHLASEGNAAA
jgi:hypothetical protein